MKIYKKYQYLLGFLILFMVLAMGEQVYASPTVSSINSEPVKLIYDYIGHYELNYTGNTNNYDYWDDTGTYKIVSKNYKDRTDLTTNNNSSATISKTDSKSKIVKAYLIWETRSEQGVTEPIMFITPNNYGVQIPAQMACKDIRTNNAGQEYTAVYTMATDVTSIVCGSNGGYGTYTVANIPVWNGAGSGVACGGESVASWQLVVVEESEDFPLRTISLNLMSQYFYNVDYSIKVDLADASAPSGVVTASFLNGDVDVDTSVRYDGIGYEDDYNYEIGGHYYRYMTNTRGLYKNGVCINDRDTGTLYQKGSSAVGGVRMHLFDDRRRTNSVESQGGIYYWAGTNLGVNVFLFGVGIDIFAYDIKFDGNGATSGSIEDMSCVYGRSYNLSKNTYTKPYYKFVGWNTKADGSGTSYKDQEYIQNLTSTEKSVTLYAQWERTGVYSITLNNQNGTTAGTPHYYEWYGVGNYTTNACTTAISKITMPTKSGHVFGGYYTGTNGTGTQYVKEDGNITSLATTFTKPTMLYAYWKPNVYRITLDNQGATSAGTTAYYEKYGVGNYTSSACTTVISKITNPTKTHYTFKGYYTGKNGEGQRIINESGSIIASSSYTLFIQNTTLYAYWEPVTYTITLDNQTPTTFGDTKFYEKYGVTNYREYKVVEALNGYQFLEYAYTGGAQYFIAPFDGTYNLLAFGASGADCSLRDGTGALTQGSIYLKEGDVLWMYVGGAGSGTTGGYNGGANGGTTYSDSNASYVVQGGGGATDFRKGGTALANRIMVSSGGGGTLIGTVADSSYALYNFYSESGRPTSRGTALFNWNYMFVDLGPEHYNWTNNIGTDEIGLQIHDYQDVRGTLKQGDVFYNESGRKFTIKTLKRGTLGNGTTGGGGGYYGGGYLEFYTPGHHTSNDIQIVSPVGASSGTSYVKGVSDGIIYGVDYSSTYGCYTYQIDGTDTGYTARVGNGVAYIGYNDYSYTTEVTPTTTIKIPTKEGYRFGGYYTGKNGTGTRYIDASGNILSAPTTFTKDTTLYAHWVASGSNTYQIAFNGNGATSGKMSIMNCSFDTNYTLPANAFTRNNGYGDSTFLGWNIIADTREVLYKDGAEIVNATEIEGSTVTLYAVWDDCPWIEAEDQYYSLEDAKSGRITYDELISQTTAFDRENGENIPSGVDEETGTAFWIADYQPTDFSIFTSDGSVTETFQVVDSVGNTYKQTITVYIVDTEPKEIKPVGTTRFIDEKYYYKTFENGGLEDNSIWKTDPEYVSVITQAFENSRNNTPIMSYHFEYEDILQMKQFVQQNGVGNSVHQDALERFYVQFMEPNTVN